MLLKKIFFISIFLLAAAVFAQGNMMGDGRGSKVFERIEQLENAKLIQVLDLKEETAVRFFSRRKDYRNKQRDLLEERQELINSINELFKEGADASESKSKEKFNDLIDIEFKILKEKENFYKSLSNILSAKQILKLALFDERFRKEVRETLMNRLRGGGPGQNK